MAVLICGPHHKQDPAKYSKPTACRAEQSRAEQKSAMARSTRNSRVRVSDRSPHFFKVFFPQFSSEHLKIPPKFREHIQASQAAAHTISLKGPSGSTWNMDLVKNSDGLFLKNGWKEFVADNSVALGDFLVFRYDGELRFTVLLFDNTACEKEAALSAMPCEDDVIVLDMGTGEENVSEEASKVSTTDRVTLKRRERERESDDCVTLEESLQKKRSKVSTKNSKDPSDNLPSLSTHSPSSYSNATRCSPRKHNQEHETLNENPSPQRRVVEDGSLPTTLKPQSASKKPNNSSRTSTFTLSDNMPSKHSPLMKSSCQIPQFGKFYFSFEDQKTWRIISQRRPVTVKELNKARQMSTLFKSTNPYVKIEMKRSVHSILHIPGYFVKEHLPDENMKMTLCDPNRKSWEVTYIFDGWRGRLSGGWRTFAVADNLEIGDVCIFELIKKYHFKVHFFRVVEELAPLLWRFEARS